MQDWNDFNLYASLAYPAVYIYLFDTINIKFNAMQLVDEFYFNIRVIDVKAVSYYSTCNPVLLIIMFWTKRVRSLKVSPNYLYSD